LTLDNLMEGLQDTQGFKDLQKTFQKQRSATPAPMEKVKADREQRKIAYAEQVKNISSWTKVVQEHRQAETLDFKPKERMEVTRESLIAKFEPKSDFEKDLEQALEAAGQEDEDAVLKAEEKALQDDLGANNLSMEEYKKRRGQLSQIRALMFYHEQKRHHMKKIKSKKYRRIRKKQRERLKESAVEAAIEDDEELANEMKEKEEVSRIQERMTLAHKNTSKWAKRILKRGKNVDMDTRKALSAQLKRGDDLRKKMLDDADGSASDSDGEDLVGSARKVLADVENPVPMGKTGLFKLSFMQKGIQKQRDIAREEARKLLTELKANELDDDNSTTGEENSESGNVEHEGAVASRKEMTDVLQTGELIAKSLEFGNSNTVATSGNIDLLHDDDPDDQSGKSVIHEGTSRGQNSGVSGYTSSKTAVSATSPSKRNDKASPESKTKTKTADPKTAVVETRNTEESSNPWMGSSASNDAAAIPSNDDTGGKKSRKGSRRMVDVDAAVNILDAGKQEDQVSKRHDSNDESDPKSKDVSGKQIALLNQEELVRRAFAAPSEKEAEDEFRSEKEKMAAEFDPSRKVEDAKASNDAEGWGSWTGMGAPPPRARKLPKKLMAPKKKEVSRKRKDDRKPDVIINQKRLKKTANGFMLGDVPHPYSSRHEYEQALLGGVGREWNVSGSFRNMTRPEILNRSGNIIKPIPKKSKAKRAPAKF
jgi:U3 small nucleolar RNA-associated protein 14